MKKKKKINLTELIFMALCCDMGIFLKKLIAPAANVITEALHIPGGIGTSFSLMFVVIGASIVEMPMSATIMSILQSLIALVLGTTGSMGILAPIGYVVPGIIIDLIFFISHKFKVSHSEVIVLSNAISGMSAALVANILVFNLPLQILGLYLSVACTSGVISGILGEKIVKRISPIIKKEKCEDIK